MYETRALHAIRNDISGYVETAKNLIDTIVSQGLTLKHVANAQGGEHRDLYNNLHNSLGALLLVYAGFCSDTKTGITSFKNNDGIKEFFRFFTHGLNLGCVSYSMNFSEISVPPFSDAQSQTMKDHLTKLPGFNMAKYSENNTLNRLQLGGYMLRKMYRPPHAPSVVATKSISSNPLDVCTSSLQNDPSIIRSLLHIYGGLEMIRMMNEKAEDNSKLQLVAYNNELKSHADSCNIEGMREMLLRASGGVEREKKKNKANVDESLQGFMAAMVGTAENHLTTELKKEQIQSEVQRAHLETNLQTEKTNLAVAEVKHKIATSTVNKYLEESMSVIDRSAVTRDLALFPYARLKEHEDNIVRKLNHLYTYYSSCLIGHSNSIVGRFLSNYKVAFSPLINQDGGDVFECHSQRYINTINHIASVISNPQTACIEVPNQGEIIVNTTTNFWGNAPGLQIPNDYIKERENLNGTSSYYIHSAYAFMIAQAIYWHVVINNMIILAEESETYLDNLGVAFNRTEHTRKSVEVIRKARDKALAEIKTVNIDSFQPTRVLSSLGSYEKELYSLYFLAIKELSEAKIEVNDETIADKMKEIALINKKCTSFIHLFEGDRLIPVFTKLVNENQRAELFKDEVSYDNGIEVRTPSFSLSV